MSTLKTWPDLTVRGVLSDLLNPGTRRIHFGVYLGEATEPFTLEDLLVLDVQDASDYRGLYDWVWLGAVRPHLEWKTEQLAPLPPRNGSAASPDNTEA